MVKSDVVRVRFKPEPKSKILAIMKFGGFDDVSKTVRHLVETGINFYQHREKIIKEIQEQAHIFTIKPNEIYPDIKLKRKYEGRS